MDTTPSDAYEIRKRAFLEFAADAQPGGGRTGFMSQLCRLELNRHSIDENSIREAIDHVNARRDCADFACVGLLRLCYQYAQHSFLSPALLEDIHRAILNFKYWMDEPGYDLMFYWTENHQILFHSAEYLAGQRFPAHRFPNANLTGVQHMQKARVRILNWIDLRARIGFSEWDSNCYYDEHIAPLINLADFAVDPAISDRARKLLDVLFFDIAVDSFNGLFATSHGRTYPRHVLSTRGDSLTTTQKIAFDKGAFIAPNSLTAVCLSTSYCYRVPSIIEAIAQDRPEFLENRERHSFDLQKADSLGIRADDPQAAMPIWAAGMFADRRIAHHTLKLADTFQSGCFDLIIRPYVDAVLKTYDALDNAGIPHDGDLDRRTLSEVNKITCRTPDYQLSCAQDFRKGKPGFQQHIWQATMPGNLAVFTLHRGSDDDTGLKYWQGRLPRAAQVKNLVIALYDIPEYPLPGPPTEVPPGASGNAAPSPAPSEEILLPCTVAAFPRAAFDEVVERNSWYFARKNRAYIALYSHQPMHWAPDGIFGAEGLIAEGRQNIYLCQMGRDVIDGPFASWIDCIANSALACNGLSVDYNAPGLGRVRFAWEGPLTMDDREISLRNYPRFDNLYCQMAYNSGYCDIRFNDQRLLLDFTR